MPTPPRVRAWGLLLAVTALALLFVAARMHSGPVHRAEVSFDDTINRAVHRQRAQIDVWRAVTTIGGPATWRVLGGLAAVGLWFARRRAAAVGVVVAIVGAGIVSGLVKALVDRARPMVPYPVEHVGGGSFPSGHAMTSATALALVVLIAGPHLSARARRWLTAVAAAVGIAIGASRVMLGVHYPSDVLGGWLLAALWLVAVGAVTRWALLGSNQ